MADQSSEPTPPPWAEYPYSQLARARQELESDDDEYRRDALIRADRCVEAAVKAFASDPPRLRAGLVIPREQSEKARGTQFPQKLEFLEWLFDARTQPLPRLIQELDYYHNLRNDAQHASTGFVPTRAHVQGAIRAAGELLYELYGVRPLTAPPANTSRRDRLDLSMPRPPSGEGLPLGSATKHSQSAKVARASGGPGLQSGAPDSRTPNEADARGLVGRKLGSALFPGAQQADPDRKGMSIPDIVLMAKRNGIPIGGRVPSQVVRSALGLTNDRFSRTGRGMWTWIDASREALHGLSGVGLLAAAYEAARAKDPARKGIHYQDLLGVLRAQEVEVRGPIPIDTLWSTIGRSSARTKFESIGEGRFVWVEPGEQPEQSARPNAGSGVQRIDVVEALQVVGPSAEYLRWLDEILRASPEDARAIHDGPDVVYVSEAAPILRLRADGPLLHANGFQPVRSAPHIRGVIVQELSEPGLGDDDGYTEVALRSERDWRGVLILAAGAIASARGLSLGEPRAEHMLEAARRAASRGLDHAFLPGYGNGHMPKSEEPPGGWSDYWARLIQAPEIAGTPLAARRPTRYASIGDAGRGGLYTSLRADRFGLSATVWMSRDAQPDDTWLRRALERRASVEARFGEPLVWRFEAGGGLFVLARVHRGALAVGQDEHRQAGLGFRRLLEALEPVGRELARWRSLRPQGEVGS